MQTVDVVKKAFFSPQDHKDIWKYFITFIDYNLKYLWSSNYESMGNNCNKSVYMCSQVSVNIMYIIR